MNSHVPEAEGGLQTMIIDSIATINLGPPRFDERAVFALSEDLDLPIHP
jgi:hypothetical protein